MDEEGIHAVIVGTAPPRLGFSAIVGEQEDADVGLYRRFRFWRTAPYQLAMDIMFGLSSGIRIPGEADLLAIGIAALILVRFNGKPIYRR